MTTCIVVYIVFLGLQDLQHILTLIYLISFDEYNRIYFGGGTAHSRDYVVRFFNHIRLHCIAGPCCCPQLFSISVIQYESHLLA